MSDTARAVGWSGPSGAVNSVLYSYVQGWNYPDYSKNIVVDEKEHPYTGTNYAWVRARCLGGKTNIWGRLALRLSDYDFKAKSHDGYGEDWPISYQDIAPYYDRVDQYLGISGVRENLPFLPDSIFQRPTRLTTSEVTLRNSLRKMSRVLTPYASAICAFVGFSSVRPSYSSTTGVSASDRPASASMRRPISLSLA